MPIHTRFEAFRINHKSTSFNPIGIVRAQDASSSDSPCSYHVFLSFRGEDTRKTFTDHLYTALKHRGFRTFRDDDEFERGENIKFELHKAIQESRISIVVFSKNYASSSWCLDELVMILKRRRTTEHVVLPVFYHVDPAHVRNQMESFEEAFTRHEERFHTEGAEKKDEWKGKIQEWRAALKEAADLAGMSLQNQVDGFESKFIHKIVEVVVDKLRCTILGNSPYLIGMHSRAKNIGLWLQDECSDVGIVAICGIGGIGKTTIAKFLYNSNFSRFQERVGKGKIAGLILDMNVLEDKYDKTVFGVNRKCQNSNKIALEVDAFARMHKLKLLQLNNLQVNGSFEDFPKGLRWLCWHGFPFKSICNDFPLESPVVLEMRYNNLQKVWEGTKFLKSLKMLDLKVHESVGHLQRLVLLNLKDCKNLRKLPRSIVMLKFLETLDISGCSNVKELPLDIGTMNSLTKLNANGIAASQLLSTTKEVKPWYSFIWPSLSKPRKRDAFPRDLSNLSSLQLLNLSNNPIYSLPNCIGGLTRLQILELDECERLQSLTVEKNLKVLSAVGCTLVEKVTFQSFPSAIELKHLYDAYIMWQNLKDLYYSKCGLNPGPFTMEYNSTWENQFVVKNYWRPLLVHGTWDNIIEIMGEFKLEPIGIIDVEIMTNLGLPNLGSMGSPTVMLSSLYSKNSMKLPLQGCHGRHIFYAYLSGSEIPTCSLIWSHSPSVFGIPEADEDLMWLSYWKFENQLEGGDELNISVVGNEDFQVKEFGVHLVYKEQEEKSSQSTSEEASQLQFSLYGNVVPGNASTVHPASKKVIRLGDHWLNCSICDVCQFQAWQRRYSALFGLEMDVLSGELIHSLEKTVC
ncbi:unnamed protein product [Camellia sinensis]